MATTFSGAAGLTSGATEVTVVSAPGAGNFRIAKSITLMNADSVSRTLHLGKKVSGTTYEIWRGTLTSGQSVVWDDPVVLTDSETIVVWADAAATTTACVWTASWGEGA